MSEASPMVSVICLSYNHEQFVEKCLLSVIGQSYDDFEIIFIDNNSSDNSFEVGKRVLQKCHRRYHAIKPSTNLGIAGGFNAGAKEVAKGKYIASLACDDWWDIDNLKLKVAFFEGNPKYGMVYGNGYNFDDHTKEITLFYKEPSINGMVLRELLKAPNINPQGILYRADVLKEVNYWDENAKVEDRDLWYRIARKYEIGYVHEPLTFYRAHNNNISRRLDYMREGNEYFFKKYEKEFPDEIAEARRRQWQYFAYHLATNVPSAESLKFMFRNYHFDWLYNKQIIKCVLNMIKR